MYAYASVYFPASARRATAIERSWGRQRTLGAREHLPRNCALCMSVGARVHACTCAKTKVERKKEKKEKKGKKESKGEGGLHDKSLQ